MTFVDHKCGGWASPRCLKSPVKPGPWKEAGGVEFELVAKKQGGSAPWAVEGTT